jgi:hypothetical protein
MTLTAINGGEQPFVNQFKGKSFVTSRFYIEDVTFWTIGGLISSCPSNDHSRRLTSSQGVFHMCFRLPVYTPCP